MTPYDSVPYPFECFPQSIPANLHAIARLFGLTPVDIQKARVLEIGCAEGGNLLPLCARFPDAGFVGIDLSANQIARARRHAGHLNLSNVELIAASITEHDFGRESFDYIIAHGFYSWVAKDVQTRLLEICDAHLSENGVAYVSYNTLPGWNNVKTIRDMMLYHSQNSDTPSQKISEARNILTFAAENTPDRIRPYKEILQNEKNILSNAPDSYLFHDHLESVNDPCYFHEFINRAEQHGLFYLGDGQLWTMFNYNRTVSETLLRMDDPIRLEQYSDFIINRRFRCTLLVKDASRIRRRISADSLGDLRFVPRYALKQPVSPETAGRTLELVSVRNSQKTMQITGDLPCTAMIEIFKALPNRLSLAGIVEKTAAAMPALGFEEVETTLGHVLPKFVLTGVFSLSADQADICTTVSEKPMLFPPVRVFCQSTNKVPNQHHENVELPDHLRCVLQYINGKNTIDEICERVKTHIKTGELTFQANGRNPDINSGSLDGFIRRYVEDTLNICRHKAFLVG